MIFQLAKNGIEYYIIKNSSGKEWLFDAKSFEIGLCLYQPSSYKGRVLKNTLFFCSKISIIDKFIKKNLLLINSNVKNALERNFNSRDVSLSIYLGTPGIHCKTIMQISKETNILGYAKLTENYSVYELFQNEYRILTNLNNIGIENIPVPISLIEVENYYMFCQSTTKTKNSISPRKIAPPIEYFLINLCLKTKKVESYNNCELYSILHNVVFPEKLKKVEKEYLYYLDCFDEMLNNELIDTCICHRDFTPWNMFYENDELFVFDWEYATDGYLPMMDIFHYEIQRKLMDSSYSINSLCKYLERSWNYYEKIIKDATNISPEIIFFAYLLDFISLYVSRGKNPSDNEVLSIEYRLEMLSFFMRKWNSIEMVRENGKR